MARFFLVIVLVVTLLLSSSNGFKMTTCSRRSILKSFVKTASSFVLQVSESEAEAAYKAKVEKERALVQEKAKAYEDRLLKDAMQVTKNQEAFFKIGKFLIIPVIGLWIYAIMNGSVLDVGTPAAEFSG